MSKDSRPGDEAQIAAILTKKELDLLEFIRPIGNLGRAIRTVHDHAVHFSEIQLEGEILGDLYLTAQVAELIYEIEIITKP
jgi:hypothetical protein